jgi:hypothetical protein
MQDEQLADKGPFGGQVSEPVWKPDPQHESVLSGQDGPTQDATAIRDDRIGALIHPF